MPGSPAGDLWIGELHRFPTLLPMATLAVLITPAALAQGDPKESGTPRTLEAALDLPDNVRVEGSIRPRYEALGNPFVAGRTEDDEFLGLQTELRAEFDVAPALTLGGELLDSRFIAGIKAAGIEMDRKVMAALAFDEPAAFAALVEKAKAAGAA